MTGAAGKLRRGRPDDFDDAHTISWSDTPHFLLVTIDGPQMSVRAIGGSSMAASPIFPGGDRTTSSTPVRSSSRDKPRGAPQVRHQLVECSLPGGLVELPQD